jgi:hypothetical protein
MRNVANEMCCENQNTHFMFKTFFSENRVVVCLIITCKWLLPGGSGTTVRHGTHRDNVGKYGGVRCAANDSIVWRMRIGNRITEATDMHSDYVILIAFPLQQWLRERASLLRYTYITCLVMIFLVFAAPYFVPLSFPFPLFLIHRAPSFDECNPNC